MSMKPWMAWLFRLSIDTDSLAMPWCSLLLSPVAAQELVLEEILITARKRTETLMSAPND
jgi:hypothetical protein